MDDYLFKDATVTRELGKLTGITIRYIKEKGKIIKRFFKILSKNKVLGFLAEVITDPQDKHLQTTLFLLKTERCQVSSQIHHLEQSNMLVRN